MGRPQLYHSAEEKKAANRAKSKRHYEKVRDILLAKRRKSNAQSKQGELSEKAKEMPSPSKEKLETNISPVEQELASWIERSTRIQKRLYTRTNRSVVDYLERMYMKFVENEDNIPIDEELSALHLLRDAIYRCEDKVLSLVGITDAYHQVKKISKEIVDTVNWVDELYVYSHLGMEEFQQVHEDREFAYQAV